MLKTLTLHFGPSGSVLPLELAPGPMTVFVGPNNSGKSLALRELEEYLETGGASDRRIVARMELHLPGAEEAAEMVEARRVEGDHGPAGCVRVSRLKPMGAYVKKRATDVEDPPTDQLIDLAEVLRILGSDEDPDEEEVARLCRDFFALFTIRLDGRTRLALTYPRPLGDLQLHPTNHLAALFRDDEARARIREVTVEAFGLHFVLDPTGGTHLRIRMSRRAPDAACEEQGLDERARDFHAGATDIAEMSDGVKAFTGLTAAVLSADYRIMLVDEPEAFLHPPLARKLGKRLTQLAADRDARVLAATHSPEFLMGCVQAGKRVNIVRLTYKGGVPSATLLRADRLHCMMRDPLLRSNGVLGALFHEGAVVCEADADRVFYQEVNERLLAEGRGGADGCVFLNAQNKQTIRRILRPLREMGIPAAAVVDLDIFKGKEDFRDLLRSAFVPAVFEEHWERTRAALQQKLRGDDYKAGGIYNLPREHRAAAEVLLDGLAGYGIFVVPTGELECWLTHLEVGGHGPEWLTQVFERMGTDSSQPSYLRPGDGDVWRFMERLAAWIGDPLRRGMADDAIPLDHLLPPPPEEDEAGLEAMEEMDVPEALPQTAA
ncbi:MAG TPA: ATP-binding protein [Longimicrobiaceae bacterium]|nr:ATP-binding protein [Longimicrobiaceae bacterium]